MTFVTIKSGAISLPPLATRSYTLRGEADASRNISLQRSSGMIDGFSLFFFLPLIVHALAGLTTGVTGVLAFRAPKSQGRHHRWGKCYLWAYAVVFLTATILSIQRWPADAYLFVLAMIGSGFALGGYVARRFRRAPWLMRVLGRQWVMVHLVGMIGSYIILWTAFYVDNAHLIPRLNRLPPLIFWVLPTAIGIPFIVRSLSRFASKGEIPSSRSRGARERVKKENSASIASVKENME